MRRRPDPPDPDHRQGLAVRLQPRRHRRRRPHHQRQRRHHDGRLDARHREPGGRPGRGAAACPASPTTARGSPTTSAAAPRPTKPFKWTYHAFWGLEDVTAVFTGMWNRLPTNKLVGEMWPNDADGLGWANAKTGQPPLLTAAGYKFVDGGRFQDGTQDYTPQITKFKAAGCRDPQRRLHPAGLRELLEAVLPAGLQAEGRVGRQGAALPGRARGDRPHRLRPHDRGAGGRPGIRSSRR